MLNYLDGYDRKEVTLSAVSGVKKGNTVSMSSSFTVKNSIDGDHFAGICTHTENYSASVLLKGFVIVPYTGENPACGYNKLSADGNGGVKKDENGREILVVSVDKTASLCGIIL